MSTQTDFTKLEPTNETPDRTAIQKLVLKVNDRVIIDFTEVSEITTMNWNDLGYLVDNSMLEYLTIGGSEYFYKDYILDWVDNRNKKHFPGLTSKKEVANG